jgi:peptidyl-prolyl cis-trans isomerase SurA
MNSQTLGLWRPLSRGIVLFLLVFFSLYVTCQPVQSAPQPSTFKILRVVDGSPISSYDLDARVKMVISTTGQPVGPESMGRIRAQVLDSLIDERIQIAEADRLGLKIEDNEVQSAISTIERTNKMANGQLVPALIGRGIDIETFIARVKAGISWSKVVRQKVGSADLVSEADIDKYLNQQSVEHKQEYLLSEIFIAAASQTALRRAQALMVDLASQTRNGSPFSDMARQFSQSPSASRGGALGWVDASQLDPRIVGVLDQLPVGNVSDPIAVDEGYYIFKLKDRRLTTANNQSETIYQIGRYFGPFPVGGGKAAKDTVLAQAIKAHRAIKSCADIPAVAKTYGGLSPDITRTNLSDLPTALQPYLTALKVGEKTRLLTLTDGVLVMMLCGKDTKSVEPLSREAVRQLLLNNHFDTEARRYLLELRQTALIEVGDR